MTEKKDQLTARDKVTRAVESGRHQLEPAEGEGIGKGQSRFARRGKTGRFSRILIANRGEIALRVARTARRLGYETVAIYSDADRQARHVKQADMAVGIGGNTPAESYLSIAKVISAARESGADAVHPGYGFLSENPAFAQSCLEAGLLFIGPSPAAIDAMGNKSRAKELMLAAGVPCIPGYQGNRQDLDFLYGKGVELGFPLMVKAAAGGGGRGLRVARSALELASLLAAARTESERAFGSGELLLELALTDARHVEIQIVGDSFGKIIHLGERDCSIQRRHQKIFEESPSPVVDADLRSRMGADAVKAAAAIDYIGAGTVEFLLRPDGSYFFLEMNTRLQVEHPVTELVTGCDLVEWQLRVAEGQRLPWTQDQVRFSGHAIEARLYAEDPSADFRGQVGKIVRFTPACERLVRTDHGLGASDSITAFYDPMLAKVISWGEDRETARRQLATALAETVILGLKTNREFLIHCLRHPDFIGGRTDTGFISRLKEAPRAPSEGSDGESSLPASPGAGALAEGTCLTSAVLTAIGVLAFAGAARLARSDHRGGELEGWASSGVLTSTMHVLIDETSELQLEIAFSSAHSASVTHEGRSFELCLRQMDEESACFEVDGVRHKCAYYLDGPRVYISTSQASHSVDDVTYRQSGRNEAKSEGDVVSPSSGIIGSIDVVPGQSVEKGAPICTVEAMKLIQAVCAPASGSILEILASVGQQVRLHQVLARIGPSCPGDGAEPPPGHEFNLDSMDGCQTAVIDALDATAPDCSSACGFAAGVDQESVPAAESVGRDRQPVRHDGAAAALQLTDCGRVAARAGTLLSGSTTSSPSDSEVSS